MNSRRLKLSIAFIIIVGGGFVAATLLGNTGNIPKELDDARVQGAHIADIIVGLSNKSATDLEKINELDRKREYAEAIVITTETIRQSQEIRDRAVELSNQITTMTKSLSEIKSIEARQALLDAITHRLALISRLITYSANLGKLLDTLRSKFDGITPEADGITQLIGQINLEVNAINSLNERGVAAMEKFDKLMAE